MSITLALIKSGVWTLPVARICSALDFRDAFLNSLYKQCCFLSYGSYHAEIPAVYLGFGFPFLFSKSGIEMSGQVIRSFITKAYGGTVLTCVAKAGLQHPFFSPLKGGGGRQVHHLPGSGPEVAHSRLVTSLRCEHRRLGVPSDKGAWGMECTCVRLQGGGEWVAMDS